jgi:transposase
MRQIREVLRLRFEKNLSEQQMAQAIGAGRSTIQGYLKKAAQAQLTWPLPAELNDEQLENLLFPTGPLKFEKGVSRPLADFQHLHEELKKKGVTLQLLWEEYQQAHPQGYQYSQFCEHYHRWAKTLDPVMRQTHKAGEKLLVDYAGMTMGVVELGAMGEQLGKNPAALGQLRETLNPLSKFDFGVFANLKSAQKWQAKT